MKSVLFVYLLLLSFTSFSQPVIPQVTDPKSIVELKDVSLHYCQVTLTYETDQYVDETGPKPKFWIAGVDSGSNFYYFVYKETGKRKNFISSTEFFNYMYLNGWKYNSTLPSISDLDRGIKFLFEKRE